MSPSQIVDILLEKLNVPDAVNVFRRFGVENADQLSDEKLQGAYRKLAFKHHPDRGGNPQNMRDLNDAYNLLKTKQTGSSFDDWTHGTPTVGAFNINNWMRAEIERRKKAGTWEEKTLEWAKRTVRDLTIPKPGFTLSPNVSFSTIDDETTEVVEYSLDVKAHRLVRWQTADYSVSDPKVEAAFKAIGWPIVVKRGTPHPREKDAPPFSKPPPVNKAYDDWKKTPQGKRFMADFNRRKNLTKARADKTAKDTFQSFG